MVNKNRQCFFFTENRIGKARVTTADLPWKNTRIYMNKMTVSEEDQFEICGFFSVNSSNLGNWKLQDFNYASKRQQIINILSAASGNVHLFTSGINLARNFHWKNAMGFIFKATFFLSAVEFETLISQTKPSFKTGSGVSNPLSISSI